MSNMKINPNKLWKKIKKNQSGSMESKKKICEEKYWKMKCIQNIRKHNFWRQS